MFKYEVLDEALTDFEDKKSALLSDGWVEISSLNGITLFRKDA